MADENKNQSQTTAQKGGEDQVKKLEADLKTAFKESRFEDVKKIAEDLKKFDPENHLADRLLEKSQQAQADALRQANAGKIKELENKMKMAFKAGNLAEVTQIADDLKKLDSENKAANKIQSQIQESKESLDSHVTKEKIKVLSAELKGLLTDKKWDDVAKKANEILGLEWGNKSATKALDTIAKEKKVEVKTLLTVEAPKNEEKKVGFLGRLFGKKENQKSVETPVQAVQKTEEKPALITSKSPVNPVSAPVLKPVALTPVVASAPVSKPLMEVKKEEKSVKDSEPVEKIEEKQGLFAKLFHKKESEKLAEDAQEKEVKNQDVNPQKADIQKEEIKKSEEDLKLALKEGRNKDSEVLIEALQKIDPENKAAKKAQEKLTKEKEKLEAQAKEEKIKGMTAELKEFLKNEEWAKVQKKASEMLTVDEKNKTAIKALKKIPESEKKLSEVQNIEPQKEEKKNIFAGVFKNKESEKPVEAVVQKDTEVKPVIPAMAQVQTPVTPPIAPAVEPKKEAPKPAETKPVSPVSAVVPKSIIPAMAQVQTPVTPPIAPAVEPKKEAPKPAETKPITTPMVAVPLGGTSEVTEAHEPKKEDAKGNMFTSLFGKKTSVPTESAKKSGSIIDTIVSQTEQAKRVKMEKKKEISTGEVFMHFAGAFLRFSIAFIVLSAGFFYVYNIDENNHALSLVGKENYAVQLKNAAETLDKKQEDEKKINKDIEKYQKEGKNESIATINKIRENRMDWPDLIQKLNEVTESVYEKNALAQYVQYNNYSYDVESGKLTVSATLSDPLGKNLTKLAEIEEAFMYYPKDKNDPNDETKPYFYGMNSFNSYAKSFNKATGRYMSSFSLNISTKKEEKGKKKN